LAIDATTKWKDTVNKKPGNLDREVSGTAIHINYNTFVRNRRLRNVNDKFADIPETLFKAGRAQAQGLRA
jgi:hypothetical protein